MIRGRDFLAGLGLAGVVWTVAFRGRSHFWEKMAVGVGALGAFAVVANPELRSPRNRPRARDLGVGLATAAALYGIFRAGDRFALSTDATRLSPRWRAQTAPQRPCPSDAATCAIPAPPFRH